MQSTDKAMITNSSSIGAGGPTGPDPRRPRTAGAASPATSTPTDSVSTTRADQLRESIANSPATRPDKLARAEALAIDPNYPPLQIIERVARMIADSQDLSEIPD